MNSFKTIVFTSITPLIDIILIFLFLFFYLYKKEANKSIHSAKINLIEKKTSEIKKEIHSKKSIVIQIHKDKKMFFNQIEVNNIYKLKSILEPYKKNINYYDIFLYVDQNLAVQFLLDIYAIFEELKCENQVILFVKNQ